jgi:hypothetical protein
VIASPIQPSSAGDTPSIPGGVRRNVAATKNTPARLAKARPGSRLVRVKALPPEDDDELLTWKVRSVCPVYELPPIRSIDSAWAGSLLDLEHAIFPLRC